MKYLSCVLLLAVLALGLVYRTTSDGVHDMIMGAMPSMQAMQEGCFGSSCMPVADMACTVHCLTGDAVHFGSATAVALYLTTFAFVAVISILFLTAGRQLSFVPSIWLHAAKPPPAEAILKTRKRE